MMKIENFQHAKNRRFLSMKIKYLFVLLTILLVVSCTAEKEEVTEETREEQVEIANPASVYCEEQGGTLRIEEGVGGQYGICTLADGTECEEWAYFRGECPETGTTALQASVSEPEHMILIKGPKAIEPRELTISSGETVVWKNDDYMDRDTGTGRAHTLAELNEYFRSGRLEPGDYFSFTFNEPGTYEYRSITTPGAQGIVIVE